MSGKFQMRIPGLQDWHSYLDWTGSKKQEMVSLRCTIPQRQAFAVGVLETRDGGRSGRDFLQTCFVQVLDRLTIELQLRRLRQIVQLFVVGRARNRRRNPWLCNQPSQRHARGS